MMQCGPRRCGTHRATCDGNVNACDCTRVDETTCTPRVRRKCTHTDCNAHITLGGGVYAYSTRGWSSQVVGTLKRRWRYTLALAHTIHQHTSSSIGPTNGFPSTIFQLHISYRSFGFSFPARTKISSLNSPAPMRPTKE